MSYSRVKKGSPVSYFLDMLLKNMSEGVLFISAEGKFLAINQTAETLLSQKEEVLLLQSFWEHFPDQSFGFSMKDALKKDTWAKHPFPITWKNRKILITPHKCAPKEPLSGVLLLLQDVTNIEAMQASLKRKSRLEELGQMSSVIAHEIKNPLGGIRGYAMLLQRKLEAISLKKMARHIVEGTLTLEALLTKILQFVKPSPLDKKVIDMRTLLQQEIEFFQKNPRCQMIACTLQVPKTAMYVRADSAILSQAILNLLLNASQAISKEGSISVKLKKEKTSCQISFIDTGSGIQRAVQKEIFSPFFTTKKEGYGLGLAEARKIVKEHEGSMELLSSSPQGSHFSITLPLEPS